MFASLAAMKDRPRAQVTIPRCTKRIEDAPRSLGDSLQQGKFLSQYPCAFGAAQGWDVETVRGPAGKSNKQPLLISSDFIARVRARLLHITH